LDPINGNDANAGTNAGAAYATWATAIAAARALSGDRTLRIMGDGVKIRDATSIDMLAWPYAATGTLRVKGYGTDLPVLTGGKVVTGWTQCTSGDEAVVGANYANIYKATIAKTEIAHTAWTSLLMTEADAPMALAMARGDGTADPFFVDDVQAMYSTANGNTVSFTTDGSGYITAAEVTSGELAGYTDAQLDRCRLMTHCYPNFARLLDVSSVASGVMSLAANTYKPETVGGSKFTVLNLLPAMVQGGWGYDDDGSGNLTLYCWPSDPANLADGIEIASRKIALLIKADADQQVELENVLITMASGSGPTDAVGIHVYVSSNVTIKQCEITNCARADADGYGAFNTQSSDNVTIEDVTIRNMQCSCGGFWNGTNASPGNNNRGSRLLVENASMNVMRIYAQQQFALFDVQPMNCGRGPHGNTFDLFFQCDQVAIVGFMPDPANVAGATEVSYAAISGSSRVLILHSAMRLSSDGRGLYDQSSAATLVSPAEHYMVNCWGPHEAERIGAYQGISVGKTSPAVNWLVANCVTPGIAVLGGTVTRKNNILTYGSTGDASEVLVAPADIHVAPDTDNFRIVGGSDVETKAGYDVESVIATFEGWLPDVNLRRDAFGRAWNPVDPGVGPFGKAA
ncbi:MAG: hypothetical protein AB7U34_07330, partial [Novosphingobium sp.]